MPSTFPADGLVGPGGGKFFPEPQCKEEEGEEGEEEEQRGGGEKGEEEEEEEEDGEEQMKVKKIWSAPPPSAFANAYSSRLSFRNLFFEC